MTEREKLLEERQRFEKIEPGLLEEHKGQFVLFKGGKVHDFFPDAMAAFEAGLQRYGLDDAFLIEKVGMRIGASVSLTLDLGLIGDRQT